MNKNKVFKFLITILIAIILITLLTQNTFAALKNIDTMFESNDESEASNHATNIFGAIISVAQVLGAGIAVIMLVVIAIQFFSASPEGKAEIKKTFTAYVTGAVIIFSAVGLLQIVKKFINKNINHYEEIS